MNSYQNQIYEVTVEGGEDIREVITNYILENKWEQVYITGAVGSVIDMIFTTPVRNELPLKTESVPVEGAAEVVGFMGEVMKREMMDTALEAIYPDKNNPLFVHIHTSCAYKGGIVRGGGLAGGKAFRSVRVFMTPI
jgi:predicted DNA-binding protein with PD1-like motif